MQNLKDHGRLIVAAIALAIAFVLSVQFSDRGVEFDLRNSELVASEVKTDTDYDLSSLKILNRVLLQIKDNYVEPKRIDPNKMLVYALDEIQLSIAEVVVEFDRDKDDHPKVVTVFANEKTKRFEIGKIESLWEMSFRLKEIFAFVQTNLIPDEDLDFRDIEYAAINGMLTTLDPHSTLLPPKHYEEMQTQTGGKFGGLGIVISVRDGHLMVVSPIDGTPAARKGIKSKDKIVRIGEESTINMNLSEAVNMLRGEPGTTVDLHVLRKGWAEPRKYVVTRAVIKIDSVDSQALSNKIGYVRIKNFQANTYPDLKQHLDKLKEKMGGIQGLVIDLRDNPGGLLDQAIKVSDLFLSEGTIVSTVGVGNRLREKRGAKESGTEAPYPLVVLVNAGSASASEIVAGALQNHNRAVVVGDTSFGKGSVQVLYEFPDNSALKLTIAQYLTPGDVSIQSKGITPDIEVSPIIIAKDEIDLYRSTHILRERDLSSHLTNKATEEAKALFYEVRYLNEELSKRAEEASDDDDEFVDPDKFKEDFEIKLAQRLLKKVQRVSERREMLQKMKPELESVSKHEFQIVQRELKRQGIDWAVGNSGSKPKLGVTLEQSTEGPIAGGDKLSLSATVTNNGSAPVYQLKALTKSDNSLYDEHEFIFGKLNPGETRTYAVPIRIPKDISSRRDIVSFEFSDENKKFEDANTKMEVQQSGNVQPQFAFSYDIQDKSGDGQLAVGESAKIRVFVQNIGKADSDETHVYLKNFAGEAIYLKKGREKLGSVKKGEGATVEFEFDIKSAPKKDGFMLEVDVYDTTYRQLTQKRFSLPFSETPSTMRPIQGLATVTGSKNVDLRAAAKLESDVAGTAKPGALLPVVGRTEGWLKVDLNGRLAWIAQGSAKLEAGKTGTLAGMQRDVMYQPPAIELTPASMMTSASKVALNGAARDDAGMKDYYIFVYNRDNSKVNTLKLNYVRGKGAKIDINAQIPLFKGMNRIAVVARDEDGMSTTESTYVYRK